MIYKDSTDMFELHENKKYLRANVFINDLGETTLQKGAICFDRVTFEEAARFQEMFPSLFSELEHLEKNEVYLLEQDVKSSRANFTKEEFPQEDYLFALSFIAKLLTY